MHLQAVSKTFDDGHVAVRDVNLTLQAGDILGLIGANGSGKSTLLGMMGGMIVPSGGKISVHGHDPNEHTFRQAVGLATQGQALDPELTPFEMFNLFAKLYGIKAGQLTKRISEITQQLKLDSFSGKRMANLSGGQRQRVHLGLLLLQQPHIMLLDEPTRALDQAMRRDLKDQLHQLSLDDRIMVIATHEADTWQSLFTRLAFMSRGRLTTIAESKELIEQYGSIAAAYTQLCDEDPAAGRSHHKKRPKGAHG